MTARLRSAAKWLLIHLAYVAALPFLLALLMFAFVMMLITEGPELLLCVDWGSMGGRLRRWLHVAFFGWSS